MGQGDNPIGLDHNTLRMFEVFNLYMRHVVRFLATIKTQGNTHGRLKR